MVIIMDHLAPISEQSNYARGIDKEIEKLN